MEIRNNNSPKIDGRRDTAGDVASIGRPNDAGAGVGKTDGQSQGDRVTLTDTAQRLLEPESSQAPVDRAKVESIRNAIADGSYKVDSARIAEKLVDLDN